MIQESIKMALIEVFWALIRWTGFLDCFVGINDSFGWSGRGAVIRPICWTLVEWPKTPTTHIETPLKSVSLNGGFVESIST